MEAKLEKRMFLMWFDPDKRRATHLKVADAVAVFHEKFSEYPALCLVNQVQAVELAQGSTVPPLPIQTAPYISRNMFYVGDFDAPMEEPVQAAPSKDAA